MTIHLKVINGNTFDPMTQGIDESAQAARSAQTQITTVQPFSGPISWECYTDEYLAILGSWSRFVWITIARMPM